MKCKCMEKSKEFHDGRMPVFREKLKRARLAFVLVVGLVMCGQMKGLAQEKRFDFTMNQQTAEEVIEALKQLTNYRFLYNHEEEIR